MSILKYENLKLKNQLIFSMLSGQEVCGRECAGCYAIRAQKRFPTVLQGREYRYELTKEDKFVEIINSELLHWEQWLTNNRSENKHRVVRIHESGEFYSSEYIEKWETIAEANPKYKFYGFTKRLAEFPEAFEHFMKLPNVFITDSLYGGSINFGKIVQHPDELLYNRLLDVNDTVRGVKICPATVDGSKCSPELCDWCYNPEGSCKYGIFFNKH